jgi:hypothetical protein
MYERPLAYVCSPLKGDASTNLRRAKTFARKVFDAGYEPFVPHLYYTTFLNDNLADERKAGIMMGLNHLKKCRILIICTKEISDGMLTEINEAKRLSIPIVNLEGMVQEKPTSSRIRPVV